MSVLYSPTDELQVVMSLSLATLAAATAPLPAELSPARQLVDDAFARLETESDTSDADIAAWQKQLAQHIARIKALKKRSKKAGGAAELAQLGRDCTTLDACLAARGAQAHDITGAVKRVVELLVAAERPGAPELSGLHRLALLQALQRTTLPRLCSWMEKCLTTHRHSIIQHGADAASHSAWFSACAMPLVECILALDATWQQVDLLPPLLKTAVCSYAQMDDIGAMLCNMLIQTEYTIRIGASTLHNIHEMQIRQQGTLTLLNKLHASWEAIWLLTLRLLPATLHRVCEGYDENERSQSEQSGTQPWGFVSRFTSNFNNLLSMQAPPDFHPPCCMLCRRVDPLEASTSHAISNCILGLYDVPGQAKQVVLDFNAMKPMTASASKWKMCCKSCEGMFSSQGEDRLAPWLKQIYDPFGTGTLFERGITQENGHVFTPHIETNAASVAGVSPLFHSILGNILRGLLFSGAEHGQRERVVSYLRLVESLRQFFAALVPHSRLVIDYSVLPTFAKCDEDCFNEEARKCVYPQPQLPSLYCFASPLLLDELDQHQRPLLLTCGQMLHYHEVGAGIECVVHLRVWGLHFVCVSPCASATLLGDVPAAQLSRHLVTPSSTRLYLWRGPPAVPPKLPALLRTSVERAFEDQRGAFHSTSADDLNKKVTQAGLYMRSDVDAAIRATQASSSAPWAQSFSNLPGYITMITAGHDESLEATEFMFRGDKEGMLPLLPRRSIFCTARGCAFHFSLYFHPVAHPTLGTLVALLWETRFESGVYNIVSFMLHQSPLEAAPLGGLDHQHLPRIYTDNVLTVVAAIMHEAQPPKAPVAFREAAAALPPVRSSLQRLCDNFFGAESDWQRCSPVFAAMERRRIVGAAALGSDSAMSLPPLPALEELRLVSERLTHACQLVNPPMYSGRDRGAVPSMTSTVTRAAMLANTMVAQLSRHELVTSTSDDPLLQRTRITLLAAFTQLARLKVTAPNLDSRAPQPSHHELSHDRHRRPVAPDRASLMLQRIAAQLLGSELSLTQLRSATQHASLNVAASELFNSTIALHGDLVQLMQVCDELPPGRAASQRVRASKLYYHRWQQLLNAIDGFTQQLSAPPEAELAIGDDVVDAAQQACRFQRGVRNQGNSCWFSGIFIALSVMLGFTSQPPAAAVAPGQLHPPFLLTAWRELLRTLTSEQPLAVAHTSAIRALRQQMCDAQEHTSAAADDDDDLRLPAFNFNSLSQEDVCEALAAFLHTQRDGAFATSVLQLASSNRCEVCLHTYDREEEEGTCVLPLPLPAVGAAAASMSVTSLLQHYLSEERAMDFRCPSCDNAASMHRQFKLRAGPQSLCLQLLRFTRDEANAPIKDVRPVQCDRTLTVQLAPAGGAVVQCEYSLQACVLHHSPRDHASGSAARLTPNSGHYTVVVVSEDEQRWELYNDDRLPRVLTEDERAAFTSATHGDPYLLIYKRLPA